MPESGDLIDVTLIDAAVTLQEPWATKLAYHPCEAPFKRAEFRSWALPEKYVGVPIVIHAGAAKLDPLDARRECARLGLVGLHYGAIVGVVVFGESILFCADRRHGPAGPFSYAATWSSAPPGVPFNQCGEWLQGQAGFPQGSGEWYAWPLLRWFPLRDEHPIYAKGKQRIWRLSPEERTCLRGRLVGERWQEVVRP